jgi:chromosome segregation ATPase
VFEPVRHIEGLSAERSQALAQTNAEYSAQLSTITAELHVIEQKIAERRSVEQQHATRLGERERAHARTEARLKRLQIEMRAVMELAQRVVGPKGGQMPAEHQAKYVVLQEEAERLKPQLDAGAAELKTLQSELRSVQNQVRHLAESARQVQAKQTALDAQFTKQLDARNQGITEAEREKLHLLATIGRQVVTRAQSLNVYRDRVVAIATLEKQALLSATETEKYLRALDEFDRATVQRGYVVCGAAALIIVFLLLVVVL